MTEDQARVIVRDWSDRKLRRYVRIAGRIWPTDMRVSIAQQEAARRRECGAMK